jgi:hypothetical protein
MESQTLEWVDTLRYGLKTAICDIRSYNGELYVLGGFGEGYGGNLSKSRDFVQLTMNDKSTSFLDSSISGAVKSAGPVVTEKAIYISLWLTTNFGQTPGIAGKKVSEGSYLVKYSVSGKFIWATKQPFHGIPFKMSRINSDGVAVWWESSGGVILATYDDSGNTVRTFQLQPGNGIVHLDLSGSSYSVQNSNQLVKLNTSLQKVWTIDGFVSEYISTDENEDIFSIQPNGYFNTTLYKYNNTGAFEWKTVLPVNCENAPAIAGDNLYVSGNYGAGNTSEGIVAYKINKSTGEIYWTFKLSTSDYVEVSHAVAGGGLYIAANEWFRYSAILLRLTDPFFQPIVTKVNQRTEDVSNQLTLAPNPSEGSAIIISSRADPILFLHCVDLVGNEVFSRAVSPLENPSQISIDLSHVARGLYLIRAFTANGIETKRLVLR